MWEVEATSWNLCRLYWGVNVRYPCNQMPLLERTERNEINLVSMSRVDVRGERLEVTVTHKERESRKAD